MLSVLGAGTHLLEPWRRSFQWLSSDNEGAAGVPQHPELSLAYTRKGLVRAERAMVGECQATRTVPMRDTFRS